MTANFSAPPKKPKPKPKKKAPAKPKKAAPIKRAPGGLTDRVKAFCREYVLDNHITNAAIRAGFAVKGASQYGSALLQRPEVQELIKEHRSRIEARSEVTAARAIKEAWGIATADVNELVEFRRRCCRYCHGIEHGYQRTLREMSDDRRDYENAKRKAIAKDASAASTYDDFDEKGGIGYDARLAPNPDCTSCWGDGIGDAFFKPTASLTPEARALYAGVKQTKDGYQMLLVDKLGGLEKVFKHLGLYKQDNEQKVGDFQEFMNLVQAKSGKLPIKGGS